MNEAPASTDDTADVDALEAHLAQTRAELADTVDQLAARLDVKSRAKERVKLSKDQLQDSGRRVRERATTDDGRPQPQAIGAVAIAVVAAVAVIVIIRRR